MMETTYRIPESVVQDTQAFRGEVEKFLAGDTSAVAFRGLRVPMGIYEQRENDTYMVRVRGAAGVFLPHQLNAVAHLSRIHGNGIIHVTTRQDLQIHGVRIEDTPTILEQLLKVELSSRGGGGNTVRNVSACPLAGVCVHEAFDVTPHALALTEYLIRERGNFNLPRKFKVAFSGCGRDCGLCSVADLGFFARETDGVRGFSVYSGGGMGAHSALGILIEDFVPENAIFEVAEAVKRLFDKHGDRANRAKARLRFVVERVGPDEFRRLYKVELDEVRRGGVDAPKIEPPRVGIERPESTNYVQPSSPSLREWKIRDVLPQRQMGLYTVGIPLALGDISARALRMVAKLAESVGDGAVRTTQDQNLQVRGVRGASLYEVFMILHRAGRRYVGAPSIRCVACAGASTCKLGLCLSRGLAQAVEQELMDVEVHNILSLPQTDSRVYISGCPNACGHHPIAAIGLYGGASRVNGRLVPFYTILAGGRTGDRNAALAEAVGRVPARAVPFLLREFFAAAKKERSGAESLDSLMSRWGREHLRKLGRKYRLVPSYEEAPEVYRDFGGSEDFSLAGRGPGECGAGVTDVIALDIDEAKTAARDGRLYDAVLAAARALLVTKGLEPKRDREVFAAFSEHLISPGWVARDTQNLLDAATDLKLGDRDSLDDLRDRIEALVTRVEALFLSLDSNLSFRIDPVEEHESAAQTDSGPAPTVLDLRGVACPMNFVRAKIELEQIEIGQVLEILLDDGEPVRNVPASFADQGQEVLSITREDSHFRVGVRKTE